MLKKTGKTTLLLCLFFLAAFSVAACSTQTPAAIPTPDLNPLRTEVAATVLAQMPTFFALTPTAVVLAPAATDTPVPPTAAPTAAPAETQATQATQASVTGTPQTKDHALWVSQTVQDDTVFGPSQSFTITWRIQNDGTSTWTNKYRLRRYSNSAFGAPAEVMLTQSVAPGETVDLTVEMTTPKLAGEYRTDWVMSNEVLRNFNEPVFLRFKVAAPPTATVTATAPKPTVTPTATKNP